jgi:putative PIN family toxin of toxin-antitoxin system
VRAVLDVNVLISAALSKSGAPAELVRRWRRGEFELLVSTALVAELERALSYPKIARLIRRDEAEGLIALLSSEAETVGDPTDPPAVRSEDPGDDYLVAISSHHDAALVSGDNHLLALAEDLPIYSPAAFLQLLAADEDDAPGS